MVPHAVSVHANVWQERVLAKVTQLIDKVNEGSPERKEGRRKRGRKGGREGGREGGKKEGEG